MKLSMVNTSLLNRKIRRDLQEQKQLEKIIPKKDKKNALKKEKPLRLLP